MNKTQFIRISDIPIPIANGRALAFEYFALRYARWLLSAGASPRTALLLSGAAPSRRDFIHLIEAQGIEVVRTEVTAKRVIPEAVLRHQGDHFNRRLFVIEGLNSDTAEACFAEMDRYVDHLAKAATWILFDIDTPQTLEYMRSLAPVLSSKIQRFIPICSKYPQLKSRTTVVMDRTACLLTSFNGSLPIDYFGWARWMRTGYGHALQQPADSLSGMTDALWRHSRGFQDKGGDSSELSQLPSVVYKRHMNPDVPYPFVPPMRLSKEDRAMVEWIESAQGDLADSVQGRRPDTNALRSLSVTALSQDLVAEAYLTAAHGFALDGDADALLDALETASKHARRGSEEVQFEVASRQIETFTLLERHLEARRVVASVSVLEPALLSPFYEARLLKLKGTSVRLLDPKKGTEYLAESERLFRRHGYLNYAAELNQFRAGDDDS